MTEMRIKINHLMWMKEGTKAWLRKMISPYQYEQMKDMFSTTNIQEVEIILNENKEWSRN